MTRPIFIIGPARSGTSILKGSLAFGAGIPGYREGHLLEVLRPLFESVKEQYAAKHHVLGDEKYLVSHVSPDRLENEILDVFRRIYAELHETEVWVEKTADVAMVEAVPMVMRAWPQARLVFARRRGIENLLSRARKFPQLTFEDNCRLWSSCMEAWLRVRESLPPCWLEVEQRQIARAPRETAERLASFLELDAVQTNGIAHIMATQRHEDTGGKEPDVALAIGDTGWSDGEIDLFRRICGPVSERLGYSETSSYYA